MKLRSKETIQQELEFLFRQLLSQKEIFELSKFYEKHERESIAASWFSCALSVIVKRRYEGTETDKSYPFILSEVNDKARPYFRKILRNKIQIKNAARNLAAKIYDIFVAYEQ